MDAKPLPTRNARPTAHWIHSKTRRPSAPPARSAQSPQMLHAWKSEARPVASSREPLLAELPHEPQRALRELARSPHSEPQSRQLAQRPHHQPLPSTPSPPSRRFSPKPPA